MLNLDGGKFDTPWAGLLTKNDWRIWSTPRAAHIFTPISGFTSSSEKSGSTLDPIVLFCGICLLAFLIAILTGEQGVWL